MPQKAGAGGSKKLAAAMGKGEKQTPWLMYFMFPVALAFGVFAFGGFGAGDDFALDGGVDGGRQLKSSIPWQEGEAWGGIDGVCELEKWLQSEFPVQGQHILCLARGGDGTLGVQVAKHMTAGAPHVNFTLGKAATTLDSIRAELQVGIGFKVQSNEWDPARKQPWTLFTTGGARVKSMAQALQARTLILTEGGQWVWPGIAVGHRQTVRGVGEGSEPVVLETVSLRPLVFTVNDFISKADAAHIREISAPHLKVDSTVSHLDHDIGKADNTWRTSQTHWLSSRSDAKGVVSTFNRKVARLTRVPSSHQEHIQMLHYKPGAGYDMHIDAFDPSMYTKSPDIMRMIDGGHTNRHANVSSHGGAPPPPPPRSMLTPPALSPPRFLPISLTWRRAARPSSRALASSPVGSRTTSRTVAAARRALASRASQCWAKSCSSTFCTRTGTLTRTRCTARAP
jgi:prolyl 4-hydroxylase